MFRVLIHPWITFLNADFDVVPSTAESMSLQSTTPIHPWHLPSRDTGQVNQETSALCQQEQAPQTSAASSSSPYCSTCGSEWLLATVTTESAASTQGSSGSGELWSLGREGVTGTFMVVQDGCSAQKLARISATPY